MKCLLNEKIVIFDVETTGLSPASGDRIIEFAAMKINEGHVVERFETLINPQRGISFGAYQVNGISNDMVKGAPIINEVLPDITNFLGDACLVAHNIKFDLGFLNNELVLCGAEPFKDRLTIDTVRMARSLVPEIGGFSLAKVAYFFDVEEEQEHRAMSDVEITYKVFCKMLEVADRKDICQLPILVNLFGIQKRLQQDNTSKLEAIIEAIDASQNINLLYFGASSGTTLRKVTPKRIKGEGRTAMLVGHCHLRNEERSFRVDRIVNLEKLS